MLKSTSSRCLIATPLHQPALHYLSKGLMGPADLWKDVEQLQLLVRRVEVEQRDDEDDHQTRQPTILREQQCLAGRTCAEVAGRTLLKLRKPGVGRKPPENSPASRPRWAPTPSVAARKLVRAPRRNHIQPLPCCATAARWPSAPTGEGDRDQPGALRYATRPAGAARRGGAIIQRQQVPRRGAPRNPHFQTSLRLEVALPSACAGS